MKVYEYMRKMKVYNMSTVKKSCNFHQVKMNMPYLNSFELLISHTLIRQILIRGADYNIQISGFQCEFHTFIIAHIQALQMNVLSENS
jgi:hypothetical protein